MESPRRLPRMVVSLLLTRAEFASVELSLALARLMRWLLLALGAAVLGLLGLFGASAFLVLALQERFGPWPLAVLALLYGGAAVWLVWRVVREITAAPPLLEQTFLELARDRDALFAKGAASGATPDAAPSQAGSAEP